MTSLWSKATTFYIHKASQDADLKCCAGAKPAFETEVNGGSRKTRATTFHIASFSQWGLRGAEPLAYLRQQPLAIRVAIPGHNGSV